ncbi:basic proline-rich protein-like [Cervus canadensis]|uniref:basic proline-rich protein-like n=1 Tax=Cervus canadensis TaxID=1574408 RepID=UPI001CA30778|nr:basic proline-rich protein-like [Cervus canadensis]
MRRSRLLRAPGLAGPGAAPRAWEPGPRPLLLRRPGRSHSGRSPGSAPPPRSRERESAAEQSANPAVRPRLRLPPPRALSARPARSPGTSEERERRGGAAFPGAAGRGARWARQRRQPWDPPPKRVSVRAAPPRVLAPLPPSSPPLPGAGKFEVPSESDLSPCGPDGPLRLTPSISTRRDQRIGA